METLGCNAVPVRCGCMGERNGIGLLRRSATMRCNSLRMTAYVGTLSQCAAVAWVKQRRVGFVKKQCYNALQLLVNK